jgi:hypothetical protein
MLLGRNLPRFLVFEDLGGSLLGFGCYVENTAGESMCSELTGKHQRSGR